MRRAWAVALLVALPACRHAASAAPGHEPSARTPASASAPPLAPAAPAAYASAASKPEPEPLPVIHGGGKHAVRGTHGMVTSVEAAATRAGVRILEEGGNAVDAAVAVAYALAVTHPSAGNIGGGGFMLIRPKNGPTTAIDFRETAPAALTQKKFDRMIAAGATGPAAVGVPGTVAGLELAHQTFGRLTRAQVMAPAIALAEKGHRVSQREALTVRWNWAELRHDRAARSIFGRGAKPVRAGELLKRPLLGATLERIAKHGRDGFYRGRTARDLVRAMGKEGMLSLADLAGYRAKFRKPLRVRYHRLEVVIMPPPSAGGVAVAEELEMLDRLQAWKQPQDSAEELHLFIEASRRALAVRRFGVVDPDTLTPAERRQRRSRWLDAKGLLARLPIDPEHATPSAKVSPLYSVALKEVESAHTTHFSVVDASGMVVSCTTTLSAAFGAKFVAPGTGIVLNNSVASFSTAGDNLPAPGRRTLSSMAPALVLRNGSTVLALGSPGGDTIPSTVVQVLRNVVDYGMTIDEAIDAPRIHGSFAPDEVRDERARPIPAKVKQELEKMGHHFSKKRIPIGDADNILIADGVAYGYADKREGGLAAGPAKAPEAPTRLVK